MKLECQNKTSLSLKNVSFQTTPLLSTFNILSFFRAEQNHFSSNLLIKTLQGNASHLLCCQLQNMKTHAGGKTQVTKKSDGFSFSVHRFKIGKQFVLQILIRLSSLCDCIVYCRETFELITSLVKQWKIGSESALSAPVLCINM